MTTVDATAAEGEPRRPPTSLTSTMSARRRWTDRLANVGMVGSFFIAAIPLALVLGYVVAKGGQVLDVPFLTEDIPGSYRTVGPGMAPAIIGTLIITGAASLLSIPLGILGAVYLNEYGKANRLARTIRFLTDVMTGVPSIVMGVFIYIVWVIQFEAQTGIAGALALAALMLPIVVRTTEEMLRLVPDELRQASTALGARTWRTTLTVVLPAALPGITSGAMLAVARAAGETAPLILVTGLTFQTNWNLFEGQNTALSAQIFRNASRPFEGSQLRAYGAALTLVALVFLLTVLARIIASRFSTKTS